MIYKQIDARSKLLKIPFNPVSDKDNEVASLLLHEDVGKFVALGGGAFAYRESKIRSFRSSSTCEYYGS
jgi:hypothetical protein